MLTVAQLRNTSRRDSQTTHSISALAKAYEPTTGLGQANQFFTQRRREKSQATA
ncbi:MAG: hypothetical protein Aurels2KO_30790 [Aureliella sp.]